MGGNTLNELVELLIDTRRLTKRDGAIRAAIADGHYVYLAHTQVIARTDHAEIPPWRLFGLRSVAAGRSMRSGYVISRAAGSLRGMWTVNLRGAVVEVALPSGGTPSSRRRMLHVCYRQAAYRPDELVEMFGVRTTSDIRTFIDIARYHGFTEGLMAADWLLSVRGCSAGQLRQEIYRMGRFVGKKTALACVDHATGASESAYESLFRAGLIQRKVTGWRFQVTLGRYRPDFLFDDFLIVEIDGRSKYADNTREVLMRERDRERALTNMGYVVLRLYPEDLHDMDRVVAEIARARKARKAPPKGRPEGPSGSA